MPYLGSIIPAFDPSTAVSLQTDAERFSGNGSTTIFTLSRTVSTAVDVDVYVENVKQEPTTAYSAAGTTLTFTAAPSVGTNNIYVLYRGSAVSNYAYVPDGSITYAKMANNIRQFTTDLFTANGTGQTFTLTDTPADANTLIVTIDGVFQASPDNYTISGSTLTLTSAPSAGANVSIRNLGFRTTATVNTLLAGTVTATELATGAVTNAKLAGSITFDKITSVSNTAITGNIISSQITSVANTQITGNIISSQITSVANTQITGLITGTQMANTGITAGIYGGANNSASITVDAQGRITSVSNVTWNTTSIVSSPITTMNVRTTGTSNTWTIPAGVTKVRVTVVGGGGNGGGGGGQNGGGGGGGGTAIKILSGLTPGNTLLYTVGSATVTSSVASGTQILASNITATGGATGSTGDGFQPGGAGGVGSGGDLNIGGSDGSCTSVGEASGGTSYLGGSGRASNGSGKAYGGGGGGGGPGSSNPGAAGVVIFEY